ncbi:MAG: VWA domain-containing protein, partial [Planctomycetes bacterium]|nr:VWA domain-containing protein [Planctomycetota bacterium]
GPPPRDDLDQLLQSWHAIHAQRAAAGRDELIERIARERHSVKATRAAKRWAAPISAFRRFDVSPFLRRFVMNRYSPVAASMLLVIALIALFMPSPKGQVYAQQEVMVPQGGRLDALDEEGNILGPCPLKRTDVDVQVSGFFSRVTLTQTYHNPYEKKIEAVYTFPMSHRAAVDRMTMTIGDRVVVGEVKERQLARQIYEAARAQGYVASLLEQERPNIFTQSVANIEPQAEVVVEISYVEILQIKDGAYSFDFPMVVGPRYIPGAPTTSPSIVPAELVMRHGLILLGPAKLTVGAAGEVDELGTLQTGKLHALLGAAQPIKYPSDAWWGRGDQTGGAGQPGLWYRFEAAYADASKEFGELYTDGTAQLNGRWFFIDRKTINEMGAGFAQDTNQVPDASRITPEPVRPTTRAGHDITVTITIDTGGPGLLDIKSDLHQIVRSDEVMRDDGLVRKVTLALAKKEAIPNRDFVLSWRQTADTIQEATFIHTSKQHGDYSGGFFTLILQPPDRVEDADVGPRELIFVMDTSGSMSGFPIEKSKEVITRAIDAMRPADTFNIITFAGRTAILWGNPRPATAKNRAEAKAFVESRQGGGGTEMMKAIEAALVQTVGEGPQPLSPWDVANLSADGRTVTMLLSCGDIDVAKLDVATDEAPAATVRLPNDDSLVVPGLEPHVHIRASHMLVTGRWTTWDGRRVLIVDDARHVDEPAQAKPMRIVLFLTDGYVGNDMGIINAVKENAHTTRVFSFGIGNSVNRYLLEGMAQAGRGEVEFVLLETDADKAVNRFTKRIETPVLTDIELQFSDGLQVTDLLPSPDAVPDLFDVKPLVIHGRYTTPGKGTLTIRGRTGAGPYTRTIDLDLPETQAEHDVIATVWARAKIEAIMNQDLRAAQQNAFPADLQQQIIALGEQFQIMTQYTSFVAVEKSRMTIGGKPVLVAVPIEMPAGVSYEGIFGGVVDREAEEIFLGARLKTLGGIAAGRGFLHMNTAPHEKLRQLRGFASVVSKTEQPAALPPPLTPPRPPGPAGGSPVFFDTRGPGPSGGFGGGSGDSRKAGKSGTVSFPWQGAPTSADDAQGLVSNGELRIVQMPEIIARSIEAPPELQRSILEVIEALDKPGRRDTDDDERAQPLLGDIPLIGELFKDASRPVLAGRTIFAEHVAMGVADLVKEGEIDDAKTLAQALADGRPDYEIGVKMRDALADESLDEAQRDATIAELGEEARKQLEAVIAKARREARLRRVLDERLYEMVVQPRPAEDRAEDSPARKDKAARKESLRLTVLVTSVDDETKQALAEAGLTIEATATSLPMIVGAATVRDLETLALLDIVRRIEPTRMDSSID